MRRIRVAVPVPALEALTYGLPDDFASPSVGARVLVPLGNRIVTGIVVPVGPAPAAPDSAAAVKDVIDVVDADAFLPGDVVALAEWVAEYYACGPGDAIGAAMPPRAWLESERHAQITERGHARLLSERGVRREILDRLDEGKPVRVDRLLGERRGSHGALLALERDGLIALTRPLVGSASAFRTIRVARITSYVLGAGCDGPRATGNVPRATGNVQGATGNVQGATDDGPRATGNVQGATGNGQGATGDGSRATGNVQGAMGRLGARQQEALALLGGAPDGIPTAELHARGVSSATLKRLSGLGLVTFVTRAIERDPFPHAAAPAARAAVALTPEQEAALLRLRALAASGFAPVVLHGVTGSGKTELYLRLAHEIARAGKGVLVLVPEIALTPAVAAAFRATFGERVAIQHSGLSDGERHDQWHRIRRGDVDVVVGTRSAVFAPVHDLGLIVVDEEHDGSYKQEETPRYHGRDVAVMRARMGAAMVVLGSATPSLESYHNARNGRYELIVLEKRVLDRPMAAVRLVDMRGEYAEHGPDVIVSTALAAAIRERLERREQAMVLLNRRGFATAVFCRQCGSTLDCPNCSVTLTVHRAARRARCHYCNYAIKVPTACGHCAGPFLEQTGFGTERVEAEIAALFPAARVERVDRDTVRRRGAITALLQRFSSGAIDILVGTQMIAKGHDFPQVTLVGVVSADVGLGLADFRAGERTFQLLTQVAGRAGRGEVAGEAVIQTIHPDHYSIRHACRQDYGAFYEEEIHFRRSMRYPPTVAMINAVVRGASLDAALADAGDVVGALRLGGESYRVLGPAPAPLSKIKGEHRAQFFVKGSHRTAMRKALLTVLESRPEIKRRTIVDVDPMSVL